MGNKPTYKKISEFLLSFLITCYELTAGFFSTVGRVLQNISNSIPNWEIREKAHPALLRFGVAFILCLIAIGIKSIADPYFASSHPFLFFYGVIVISAWYGGSRPGIFAAIFVSVFAYYAYLKPLNPDATGPNVFASFTFFIQGLLVVGISATMHKTQQEFEEKKRYTQYYANIARHISDAVISTDEDLIIQSWNDGAEQLYGWKADEVLGNKLHDIISYSSGSNAKRSILEVLDIDEHWKGEVVHHRKNGSRIHILTSVSKLYGEDNEILGVVMVNKDITDRKKLEQGKDDFIALASHELKTPLTSVKLYTGILKQLFTKNADPKPLEYLSKVDGQIGKLLELVNHLLDVSKVQAGKIQYQFEPVELDKFVVEVAHDIQQITTSHTLTITGKTGKIVAIDKDRLRQAIVNILNNAIKYSAQAHTVNITLTKERDQVRVAIQDFGVGIPKEKQHKIFDRFYQVNDSKGYTYSGMGLGLYITHEIIEKHNGKLWVESEEDKGSTFIFTLPTLRKGYEQKKDNSPRR
ncbi:MAG: ATP-binding protein [Patescibacteria group bacterium]